MFRQIKGEPDNRLERLAAAALVAIEDHPDRASGDRVVVLFDDGRHGGIGLGGYEQEIEALGELLAYAVAFGRSLGKTVQVRVRR